MGNNPVDKTDPSGTIALIDDVTILAIVVVVIGIGIAADNIDRTLNRKRDRDLAPPLDIPVPLAPPCDSEISRRKRCEFRYEFPPRNDRPFKICAYDCKGYGGLATFPWPKDLPCPESFDDLFPNIPPGYPDPNAPN